MTRWLRQISAGVDDSVVETSGPPKTIAQSKRCSIISAAEKAHLLQWLCYHLYDRITEDAQQFRRHPRTLILFWIDGDWKSASRRTALHTLPFFTAHSGSASVDDSAIHARSLSMLHDQARALLKKSIGATVHLRCLSIAVSGFCELNRNGIQNFLRAPIPHSSSNDPLGPSDTHLSAPALKHEGDSAAVQGHANERRSATITDGGAVQLKRRRESSVPSGGLAAFFGVAAARKRPASDAPTESAQTLAAHGRSVDEHRQESRAADVISASCDSSSVDRPDSAAGGGGISRADSAPVSAVPPPWIPPSSVSPRATASSVVSAPERMRRSLSSDDAKMAASKCPLWQCGECGLFLPQEREQVHLDFHVAQRVAAEMDIERRSATGVPARKRSAPLANTLGGWFVNKR
jgi:hypothetical protein